MVKCFFTVSQVPLTVSSALHRAKVGELLMFNFCGLWIRTDLHFTNSLIVWSIYLWTQQQNFESTPQLSKHDL